MITLGICEDSKKTREEIKTICKNIGDSFPSEYKMIEFTDGEMFLSFQESVDILVLDIELPKINGITIKNRLQERREETLIIFVTNHEELIKEAFGIYVIGFVNKSEMEIQLTAMLTLALQMKQFVMLEGNIDSRDILYIEADHGYCHIIMRNKKKILLHKSLNELQKSLQEVDFIRIHRSYLVNLKWVKQLEKGQMDVEGEKLSVSVREWAKVKKSYDRYCKINARYS